MDDILTTRRVFISYCWTSDDHQNAVIDLATRLRSNGVDVILDVWEVREGHDVHSFMERMVTDSTIQKVLIISDRGYSERANDRKGGVGIESQIISPEIYQKVEQTKFIPILFERDENGEPWIPAFLRVRIAIDLSSIVKRYENYERLLRAIYDKPLHVKPLLGTPPELASAPIRPSSRYRHERVIEALVGGRANALVLVRDYLRGKADELESYRIEPSSPTAAWDDPIYESIKSMLGYRDEVVDLFVALFEHRSDEQGYEEVLEFFQALLALQKPPQVGYSIEELRYDDVRFLTYELFLYFVAVLIRARRFDECDRFLGREFYVETRGAREVFFKYSLLRPYIRSLEEARNNRLQLRRVSVMADLIKERAGRRDIGFAELMETDVALYLRSHLVEACDSSNAWYPCTMVYGRTNAASRLFRMAESTRHFLNLKKVLGVTPDASGGTILQRFLENGGKLDLSFGSGAWPVSLRGFINVERLGTRP